MTSSSDDRLLEEFANAPIDAADPAAKAILSAKLVNKSARDPRVVTGLRRRMEGQAALSNPARALALGYRLGAAARGLRAQVKDLAVPLLPLLPTKSARLEDGEDRYYLGLAVADAPSDLPWLTGYIADQIAGEETAEKARLVLVQKLVAITTLDEAIRKIADSLERLPAETKDPQIAVTKRLKRILVALRAVIVKDPCPPGAQLATAVRELFFRPFGAVGLPENPRDLQPVAKEGAGLVYDLLRTQVSIVAEPAIYNALGPLQNRYGPVMWARFARGDGYVQRIAQTCEAAILLIALQGHGDKRLLDALTSLLGSREDAKARVQKMAKEDARIRGDVRDWLSNFGDQGAGTPKLESFEVAHEFAGDELIGGLMASARVTMSSLEDKNLDSRQAVQDLCMEISNAGKARNLRLRHEVGDKAEYSQQAHELVGGHKVGIREVRVVRPGIEKVTGDSAEVVIKAIVEPV